MDTFNPSRLTLARESLGWTKAKLADKAGISARRLSDYENRGHVPPPATATSLATALKVDEAYFHRGEIHEPTSLSFRSLRSMPAGVRDMAIASATMTAEVAAWINGRLELQPVALPTDLIGADPNAAADVIRARWGLGLQPAPNLVHLCELMGVRVFALAVQHRALDAFSFWDGEHPYILINARGTAERRRWDVAHELGHLVLHAGGHHLPTDRGREDEADLFASELLMPAEGIRRDAITVSDLGDVRSYKLFWKVSAISLIRRLHRLGYLSDWQYRNVAIDASKAKLRRFEDDIPAETSPTLTAVLSELRTRGLGPRTIAQDLDLRSVDVRNMFHSLAPVELDGGGSGSGGTRETRPQLRVVR